ncbi:MAG: outer membrane beta-barrel protein [Planctomycetes bacterium]|nr:outer membrane beta-barrel protein [Planctomycetota bacterium]
MRCAKAAGAALALLSAHPAVAQQDPTAARDAALGAPLGPQLGTPINEAEARDVGLGDPRPTDRAPFTPPARTELGRAAGDPTVPQALGRGIRLANGVALSPYYNGAAVYDTNIFRSPDGFATDDVELRNTLGLDLAIVRRTFSIEAGYAATHRSFVQSDLSMLEHRARLMVAGVGRVVSGRLRADFGWLERPDDPRFASGVVKRNVLDVGAAMDIRLSRSFGLVPEALLSYQLFRSDRLSQATNISYGGNLLAAFSPWGRITLLAGVGYRELNYLDDQALAPDLRILSLIGGVELRFSRTITGQARIGYDWSEVTERRAFPQDADPPRGFTAGVNLRWEALRTTALTLQLLRQIDFGVVNTPLFLTRVAVGVEQALPLRLGLALRASYEDFEPVRNVRGRVQGYSFAGGLGWAPRPWFQLGVEASHLIREGGAARGDFDVTRVGVTLTLRY